MRGLIALAACILAFAIAETASPAQDKDKTSIVTAAQVNGTWKNARNEFKILALGKNRLKVEFYGTHEYRTAAGPGANTGELSGVASIEGTIATLKQDDGDEKCTLTLKFKAGRMEVSEDGVCGFGAGVFAEGIYRRVSSRKPTFTDQ